MSRPRCPDCGAVGEREGHMTCQYPGLKLATKRVPHQPSREERNARLIDTGPLADDDQGGSDA